MSKMIQLRNVPETLHRTLKARAAMAGMSSSDYLLEEIREVAERPTLTELRARLRRRKPVAAQLDTAPCAGRTCRKNAPHHERVIVLDATAAIDWLLQTSAGQRIDQSIFSHNESLHAPHLLDLEAGQVLRRLTREGAISARRAEQAIEDLLDLRMTRYPHFVLLPRIWQLRHNLSVYHAAYVALAEKLGARGCLP
jgi:predicted nucleic acid-binding protein/plasmid stability protein